MTTVVPFPTVHRSTKAPVETGTSAQIYILPVVRIERHAEPAAIAPVPQAPRHPLGPFFSGGGRRAR